MRCASAGAERPKCGLRADPAYVVIPQGKKKTQRSNGTIESPLQYVAVVYGSLRTRGRKRPLCQLTPWWYLVLYIPVYVWC